MVGALLLKVFKPLPGLVKALSFLLGEGCNLCPHLCSFPGRKYLLRKALDRTSQVVNELGSSFCSQSLALSLNEKEKSRSQIASADTPLSLIESHFARNLRRCALGLSEGYPPNWSHSTKLMSWVELKIISLDRRANNR